MLTQFDRTVMVPEEFRFVVLEKSATTVGDRTVLVPAVSRVIIIQERQTTSADRTVHATEDAI